jgi:hypothetical protein
MNSVQKQSSVVEVETPETFVASFEKNLATMDKIVEVEQLMKKLKFLGLNYDPFTVDTSNECQQVISNLGLAQHLANPYLATNILLRLLDKTEEHLNNLKQ